MGVFNVKLDILFLFSFFVQKFEFYKFIYNFV